MDHSPYVPVVHVYCGGSDDRQSKAFAAVVQRSHTTNSHLQLFCTRSMMSVPAQIEDNWHRLRHLQFCRLQVSSEEKKTCAADGKAALWSRSIRERRLTRGSDLPKATITG
jgi:hypothetical protein